MNNRKNKNFHCINCGHPLSIDDKKYCPGCGAKIKKKSPIKTILITVVIIFIALFIFGSCSEDTTDTRTGTVTVSKSTPTPIVYENVEISDLISEYEGNKMRAKDIYLNKYVCFSGKIEYITENGDFTITGKSDDWFGMYDIECCWSNSSNKNQIMNYNEKDVITCYGKIKDIDTMFSAYKIYIDRIE